MVLHALDQNRIQSPKGGHMQLGAGFGQRPVGDVAQQAALAGLVGKEAVELGLHTATAKATQGGHECGQGQLARAGEGVGGVGMTRRGGKGRAVKVF